MASPYFSPNVLVFTFRFLGTFRHTPSLKLSRMKSQGIKYLRLLQVLSLQRSQVSIGQRHGLMGVPQIFLQGGLDVTLGRKRQLFGFVRCASSIWPMASLGNFIKCASLIITLFTCLYSL